MTSVDCPDFWARTLIVTFPSLISWTLEREEVMLSFVANVVNENGNNQEYFSQVFFVISSVIVASSPVFNCDLLTTEIIRSYWVIKCSAKSVRLTKVSGNFFVIELSATTGVVGGTTTGGWTTGGCEDDGGGVVVVEVGAEVCGWEGCVVDIVPVCTGDMLVPVIGETIVSPVIRVLPVVTSGTSGEVVLLL